MANENKESVSNAKVIKGIVKKVSDKNTVQVNVETIKQHPKYKKSYKSSKRYPSALPENIKVKPGDTVLIQACRPISKTKKWFVKEVVS